MNGAASRQSSNSTPPTLLATKMPTAPNRLKMPMTDPRMRCGDCWAINTELVTMQPTSDVPMSTQQTIIPAPNGLSISQVPP